MPTRDTRLCSWHSGAISRHCMRFAAPLSFTCPSCGKHGSYAPPDLVREQLRSWRADLATMDVTTGSSQVPGG